MKYIMIILSELYSGRNTALINTATSGGDAKAYQDKCSCSHGIQSKAELRAHRGAPSFIPAELTQDIKSQAVERVKYVLFLPLPCLMSDLSYLGPRSPQSVGKHSSIYPPPHCLSKPTKARCHFHHLPVVPASSHRYHSNIEKGYLRKTGSESTPCQATHATPCQPRGQHPPTSFASFFLQRTHAGLGKVSMLKLPYTTPPFHLSDRGATYASAGRPGAAQRATEQHRKEPKPSPPRAAPPTP